MVEDVDVDVVVGVAGSLFRSAAALLGLSSGHRVSTSGPRAHIDFRSTFRL